MKKFLLAVALASTAIGGMAIAAQNVPHGPMRADTNKDGIVSRSEYFAAGDMRFKKRDTNGDRRLAATEIRGGKMQRADRDGDGAVSFEEATAAVATRFARLDRDKDGNLTAGEMTSGMRGGRAHRGAGMMQAPDGPRGRMGGGMLQRIDTDKDGRISRAEMRAQTDQHFDRLDANKDGFIDQAEMKAPHGPGRGDPGRDMPPLPEDAGE